MNSWLTLLGAITFDARSLGSNGDTVEMILDDSVVHRMLLEYSIDTNGYGVDGSGLSLPVQVVILHRPVLSLASTCIVRFSDRDLVGLLVRLFILILFIAKQAVGFRSIVPVRKFPVSCVIFVLLASIMCSNNIMCICLLRLLLCLCVALEAASTRSL